ncbi:hypothetical protein PTKU46_83140 [Paraburkholderia terrae]
MVSVGIDVLPEIGEISVAPKGAGVHTISLEAPRRLLLAPMKYADSILIRPASSKLVLPLRSIESRSYLACHHTRLLRNLSTFTLC